MIGLNLLPDVKKEFIKAQRTRNTVIGISTMSMMIAVGLTIFLALFVYLGQTTAINLAKDDIASKQKELESKPEIGKYLTIQNQLNALNKLHGSENKIVYSRLLDYLPLVNPAPPNNFKVTTIKVTSEDTLIVLNGVSGDFQAVNVLKTTLENTKIVYKSDDSSKSIKLFSKVEVKSASLSKDSSVPGVTFEFALTYSKEAFSPDSKEIIIEVPKLTVSDSKDNAPVSLFEEGGDTSGKEQ